MGEPTARIALVSTYAHLSRNSMERMLRLAFPEWEVENFSVNEVVKRSWFWMPRNLWYVAKECGAEVLQLKTSPRHAFYRTTHAFTRLRAAMQHYIRPERHVFSFQMQSLYNTSVPGVPVRSPK